MESKKGKSSRKRKELSTEMRTFERKKREFKTYLDIVKLTARF